MVLEALCGRPGGSRLASPDLTGMDPLADDDFCLALYILYELHYRSFGGVDDRWEWDPALLSFRAELEIAFENALLAAIPGQALDEADVADQLRELAASDEGPSLSRFVERRAESWQVREFMIHRSAYQLKEADPHSWALPRLSGGPKAALVEIQADEYGGGDPARIHAELFGRAMAGVGLSSAYGAYLPRLPGPTLAAVNLMSLFGLHRRWRGAVAGHLALLEMTSTDPNRRYGNGLRRLGYGEDVTDFFDEHVEADAVHENIAAHDLAAALAREEQLGADVLFGARALLELDRRWTRFVLSAWRAGCSSLLEETK